MEVDGWYHISNIANDRSVEQKTILTRAVSNLKDPTRRPFKYLFIIFPIIFTEFAFTYCIEIPAGIQSTIIRAMHIDGTQYGLIYSATYWPDIFTSIVGVMIVNKWLGTYRGFILFTTFTFFGQLICSIGALASNYWTLVFGRFVIGCTYGTHLSIVNMFYLRWFRNKEISFICSLGRCMGRLGATSGLNIPELMYQSLSGLHNPSYQHGITQMFGTFLCLLMIGCAATVVCMDRYSSCKFEDGAIRSVFSVRHISKLPLKFWGVAISLAVFYAIPYALAGYGVLFFTGKYRLSIFLGNFANSLSYTSIIALSPLIGLLIDKTGYHLSWGILGLLLAMIANVLYISTEGWQVYIPFLSTVMYSLCYSFFGCSIWVLPGFLVSSEMTMTVYSLTGSITSLSISMLELLSGTIVDYYGFFLLILCYLLLLLMTLCIMLALTFLDLFSNSPVLNVSTKFRNKN